MADVGVLQGEVLEKKAKKILKDKNVEYIHVHNEKRGCFAVQIERE